MVVYLPKRHVLGSILPPQPKRVGHQHPRTFQDPYICPYGTIQQPDIYRWPKQARVTSNRIQHACQPYGGVPWDRNFYDPTVYAHRGLPEKCNKHIVFLEGRLALGLCIDDYRCSSAHCAYPCTLHAVWQKWLESDKIFLGVVVVVVTGIAKITIWLHLKTNCTAKVCQQFKKSVLLLRF